MTSYSASEVDRTSPTLEDALGALADDRRRRVIRYLLERDGADAVGLGELAEAVADGTDVEAVRRSLHHAHIPHLDEAGIVDYDAHEEHVRLAGDLPTVEAFLEAANESPN